MTFLPFINNPKLRVDFAYMSGHNGDMKEGTTNTYEAQVYRMRGYEIIGPGEPGFGYRAIWEWSWAIYENGVFIPVNTEGFFRSKAEATKSANRMLAELQGEK